jgi:uncharacterized repeat protein (TIGR04138 family)
MPKKEFVEVVEDICVKDLRYNPECYSFVREGLDFTIKALKRHRENSKSHVSGQELLSGLREFALREFGPMSKTVLNEWGVKNCEDFGQIVFNLVSAEVLGKTDTDSLNDFKSGFSFDEAFVKPFKPRSLISPEQKAPRAPRRPRKTSPKSKPKSGQASPTSSS